MYLHGSGVQTTSKLLNLTLHTLDDWNCQKLLIHSAIQLQNLMHLSTYQFHNLEPCHRLDPTLRYVVPRFSSGRQKILVYYIECD